MTPELALWAGVKALLLADPAVAAICGDKIYDEVPADRVPALLPYVYLGPINRQRREVGCGKGANLRLRVYCATAEFGRDQAWTLADAVAAAVDEQEPDVEPFAFGEAILAIQLGDVINPLAPKEVFVDLSAVLTGPA